MKLISKFILAGICLFSGISSKAQLSGTYNVPGTFTSLAAAISSLNSVGASAAVTINIAAGYSETVVSGGYQLNTITQAVTFQKSGVGANPLLLAYTGVGSATSSTVQDGIWRFIGSDYITLDGLDLLDTNTTNPATMEFGFGFFKQSNTNGCQNNTIKNCNITLNKINYAFATIGQDHGGSKGIYFSCASNTFLTQEANLNSSSGANSYNKIYSNSIQNCHIGISLTGYNDQGYIVTSDIFNDVGGTSSATSNTITNFGGGPNSTFCAGITASYQYSFNASYNVINNNNGSGASPQASVYGIRAAYHSAGEVSINSNTISINAPAIPNSTFTPMVYGISCARPSTIASITATANITINNNVFPSFIADSPTSTSGGSASVIYHSVNPSNTSISNNFIQNVNLGPINFAGINCAIASTCALNSNTVTSVVSGGTAYIAQTGIICGAFYNVVSGNLVSGVSLTSGDGGFGAIGGGGNVKYASVISNTINNIVASSGQGIGIGAGANQATLSITDNVIYDLVSANASSNSGVTGISVGSGYTGARALIKSNTIYSLSTLAASTATNVYVGMNGIYVGNIHTTISANKIYGLFSNYYAPYVFGIYLSGYQNLYTSELSNNIILDLESQGDDSRVFAIRNQGVNCNITFNSIYLNSAITTTGSVSVGVVVEGQAFNSLNGTSILKNNIIVNNSSTSSTDEAYAVIVASLSLYGLTSERNILYAGIPSANHIVARVGSASYTLVNSFKSAVSPREIQTFTENPVFTTTAGSAPNTLVLDPTVLTLAEGGARRVNGVITDYGGTTRDTLGPDIGAWETNMLGSDRVPPLCSGFGFTSLPCNNFTGRTFTMTAKDSSGIAAGSLAPRIYYKINSGSYSSVQGVLSSGTATNGVWTFNLVYSASIGSSVSWFVVIQDQSIFSNITVLPAGGGNITSVTNITTYPGAVGYYMLQSYPIIGVNSGSICAGSTFSMQATGVSSFTFSSGSATVNPVTTTSYSVTGRSSEGCPATNTAVATVTVYQVPVISIAAGGTLCAGTVFTLNPSGATNYTYSGGSATFTPLTNKTFTIVGQTSGCYSQPIAVSFTVIPAPVLNISISTKTVCAGEEVSMLANGAVSYLWLPDSVSGNGFLVYPTVTTVYSLQASGNTGCKTNTTIAIKVNECVGLNEKNQNSEISLFPNPSKGTVFISGVKEGQNLISKLYNSIGQEVAEVTLRNSSFIFPQQTPKGIYFLVIFEDRNIVRTQKLILE